MERRRQPVKSASHIAEAAERRGPVLMAAIGFHGQAGGYRGGGPPAGAENLHDQGGLQQTPAMKNMADLAARAIVFGRAIPASLLSGATGERRVRGHARLYRPDLHRFLTCTSNAVPFRHD